MAVRGKPKLNGTIEDIAVNETRYAVPWSLIFDKLGNPYLNLNNFTTIEPTGINALPITRIGFGTSDFDVHVDLMEYVRGEYVWELRKDPFVGVIGDKSKIVPLNTVNDYVN